MPDEFDAGDEQASEETAPEAKDDDQGKEALEDIVEGFEVKEEETKEEAPPGQGESKIEVPKEVEEMRGKVNALEKHIQDLDRALHQERQKRKEDQTKKQPDDEPLTGVQLKELIKEHKDDPDALYNIIDYMTKQGGKAATKEALTEDRLKDMRAKHDDYVTKTWPDMAKEGSQLGSAVSKVKSDLLLENHPMGYFLSIGTLMLLNINQIQQAAYEKGKMEAAGEKAEKARKDGVEGR